MKGKKDKKRESDHSRSRSRDKEKKKDRKEVREERPKQSKYIGKMKKIVD